MVHIDPKVGAPKFALLAFLAECSKYLPISKVTDLRLELIIKNSVLNDQGVTCQAVVQGTGTPSLTLKTCIVRRVLS